MALVKDFNEKVDLICRSNKIFYTGWMDPDKQAKAVKLSKLKGIPCAHLDHIRKANGKVPFVDMYNLEKLLLKEPKWVLEGFVKNERNSLMQLNDLTIWNNGDLDSMLIAYEKYQKSLFSTELGCEFDPDAVFWLNNEKGLQETEADIKTFYSKRQPVIEISSPEEMNELAFQVIENNLRG